MYLTTVLIVCMCDLQMWPLVAPLPELMCTYVDSAWSVGGLGYTMVVSGYCISMQNKWSE